MEKLTALETSVSKLSDKDYASFREWFWKQENERWDNKLEKDIADNKLESIAEKAVEDFKQGKFKKL